MLAASAVLSFAVAFIAVRVLLARFGAVTSRTGARCTAPGAADRRHRCASRRRGLARLIALQGFLRVSLLAWLFVDDLYGRRLREG
jgi:uncharacterized membrane protein AbrB (regulator of aidB expression)